METFLRKHEDSTVFILITVFLVLLISWIFSINPVYFVAVFPLALIATLILSFLLSALLIFAFLIPVVLWVMLCYSVIWLIKKTNKSISDFIDRQENAICLFVAVTFWILPFFYNPMPIINKVLTLTGINL